MPRLTAARLAALGLFLVAGLAEADEPARCHTCGHRTYGTSINWTGSPSDAAHQAKAEEKLVFVLHVSGHFEDPKVT